MESIYWVLSRDCNQACRHCYNDSRPGAAGLTADEASRCVAHLPDPDRVPVDRIILSGGEVLVFPELLFHTLRELGGRYGDRTRLMVQTNGDLLTDEIVDEMVAHRVVRIDVASQDQYHHRRSVERRAMVEAMLGRHGYTNEQELGPAAPGDGIRRTYAFWGATQEAWIGPLWPRGRARRFNLSAAGPEHRFCDGWSGARGFLDYEQPGSELNIQLEDVYPCCPMTCRPLGSLLDGPVLDLLDSLRDHPVYRALNEGRPEAMGESYGISEQEGFARSRELGNHCLWCDEFFERVATDLLARGARTERGAVDLPGEPHAAAQ